MFNFFEEIFAPGRRHAAEERKRLELSRVDLGVGDPGRGPIDLASGKVVVRAPGVDGVRPTAQETEPQDRPDEALEAESRAVPGARRDADPEPAPGPVSDGPDGAPGEAAPHTPTTGRDVRP